MPTTLLLALPDSKALTPALNRIFFPFFKKQIPIILFQICLSIFLGSSHLCQSRINWTDIFLNPIFNKINMDFQAQGPKPAGNPTLMELKPKLLMNCL